MIPPAGPADDDAPHTGRRRTPPNGAWCRLCLATLETSAQRCGDCGGVRPVVAPVDESLTIAHLDCDAFYAAVEKRDRPELADRPVIIGGGRRGVVATACYIARAFGVRSAMPMFKALRACPDAVVLRPDMAKYVAVSRQIRARLETLTPLVEPISIDEAFLDLKGCTRLNGAPPALALLRLQRAIETELGVGVSVGLSVNKFLAKLACEQDKPRGFAVIAPEAVSQTLAPMPLSALPGVGPAFAKALARRGLHRVSDVRGRDDRALAEWFGEGGVRLARLARGEDARPVRTGGVRKSVSAETTFEVDLADRADLEAKLWRCCERVATRAKAAGIAGSGATLKLKTANFRTFTRARRLPAPTQMAHRVFAALAPALAAETDGRRFRLIGAGLTDLCDAAADVDLEDLFDQTGVQRDRAERAMDAARAKFGADVITTGRAWRRPDT